MPHTFCEGRRIQFQETEQGDDEQYAAVAPRDVHRGFLESPKMHCSVTTIIPLLVMFVRCDTRIH